MERIPRPSVLARYLREKCEVRRMDWRDPYDPTGGITYGWVEKDTDQIIMPFKDGVLLEHRRRRSVMREESCL